MKTTLVLLYSKHLVRILQNFSSVLKPVVSVVAKTAMEFSPLENQDLTSFSLVVLCEEILRAKDDVCAFLCVHLPDDRRNWQTVCTQGCVCVRLLQEVRSGFLYK